MKKHARVLTAGSLLALAIWLLAAPRGRSAADEDADKIKEAHEAIARLVDGKGDARSAAEGLLKKEVTLENVMQAFKPRNKHGFGVGEKGTGIEQKLQKMESARVTPADLA